MDFNINNFFEPEECKSIIDFANENGIPFSYNPKELWDCKRIYDNEFNNQIIQRLKTKYKNKEFNLWFDLDDFDIKNSNISLTKYYDGRWLDLHLDTTSQFTTVIVLSEDFEDGRFALSKTRDQIDNSQKYHLKIGQSISFDGSKIYHGVMPVSIGERYALNIWMTNTDFKYMPLKNKKSII